MPTAEQITLDLLYQSVIEAVVKPFLILILTPFWVKYLENFTILSLWTQLLLEFSSDVYQTWYVHSPKHKDDPCEKGSRSGVI